MDSVTPGIVARDAKHILGSSTAIHTRISWRVRRVSVENSTPVADEA